MSEHKARRMRAREGDLLETVEGLIFDVKGLMHPPNRTVAFVRYFPYAKGKRKRGKRVYGKLYSLSKRYEMLKTRFPKYLFYDSVFDEILCEVPVRDIKKHYDPAEKLQTLRTSRELDALEDKAVQLAELLKKQANIPWSAIGVSGSILVGLHTRSSDIDQVVYGSRNCRKAYSVLGRLLRDMTSWFKPYTRKQLNTLFDFRSKDTAVGFEDFERTESRKVLQGKFMGTDYFIRFVKDWGEATEKYGDLQYRNAGYGRIRAAIVDDSESIFTPCRYVVENVQVIDGPKLESVAEIASFRGRFCEQARKGETVVARGKIEHVTDHARNQEYHRLLIGNKPTDFMNLA